MADAPRAILVADDQPGVRRLVREVLGRAGYRVLETGNGSDAVDLFQQAGPIELVLTDVVMPRMNGVAFIRWVRERYPEQRILCMSGQPVEVLAQSNVADLAMPFLAKPFTGEELLAKVSEVMQAPVMSRNS